MFDKIFEFWPVQTTIAEPRYLLNPLHWYHVKKQICIIEMINHLLSDVLNKRLILERNKTLAFIVAETHCESYICANYDYQILTKLYLRRILLKISDAMKSLKETTIM